MSFRALDYVAAVALCVTLVGCNCGRFSGQAHDLSFRRCAQSEPVELSNVKVGALSLTLEDRVLSVRTGPASLKMAVFTGPVGAPLTRVELGRVSAAAPDLVVMLGGLGDTPEAASASVAGLAALGVPALFIAGGADRFELVEDAFDTLDHEARKRVIDASGLRELRIGQDRFAIMSGAPLGRYARDDESCGFSQDDLDVEEEAFGKAKVDGRRWLLSWAAPSGWGVSAGLGRTDVGSEGLARLAEALDVRGGLFAYPESAVGLARKANPGGGLVLVVPRLGRTGATRSEGGRLPSGFSLITVGSGGIALSAAGR